MKERCEQRNWNLNPRSLLILDEKITAAGFHRQNDEVRYLPKDSMKLLFNPYKNVGVYVENVWNTIFPIANEKKGKDFQMHAFARSGCVPLMLRLFV